MVQLWGGGGYVLWLVVSRLHGPTSGSRHVCVATGSASGQLVWGQGIVSTQVHVPLSHICAGAAAVFVCCCRRPHCAALLCPPPHSAAGGGLLGWGRGVITGPAAVAVMQAAGLNVQRQDCCINWPCLGAVGHALMVCCAVLCCADDVPGCVCGCRLAAPCLFMVVCSPHMWSMAWSGSTGKHARGCWARTPALQAAAVAAAAAAVAVAAAVTGGILRQRS